MAVLPPPTTAMSWPRQSKTGSSYSGNSFARIRLTRVRNSLAE